MPLEFLTGLKKLKNESISLISSEFAVGHYVLDPKKVKNKEIELSYMDKEKYTKEILKLSYAKLKPKGKLILLVFADLNEKHNALENIRKGISSTNFKAKIQEVPAKKLLNIPTEWSKIFSEQDPEGSNKNNKFYKIILEK